MLAGGTPMLAGASAAVQCRKSRRNSVRMTASDPRRPFQAAFVTSTNFTTFHVAAR